MNGYRIYPAHHTWPITARDLSETSVDVTRLRLVNKATGLERLKEFTRLESLWCFGIDQKALICISECTSLEELHLDYNLRIGDIACLFNLKRLKVLTIDSCSKIESLNQISRFEELEGLSIVNFKNVHSIEPLSRMKSLRELGVAGSIWTRMKIDSLQPLSNLLSLEYLDLTNLKVQDESLRPIAELRRLKELSIANFYPMREFASLAGKLPETKCSWFKPYVEFAAVSCAKCGRHSYVLLTGKGTSKLCKYCDAQRLARHVNEFEKIAADAIHPKH